MYQENDKETERGAEKLVGDIFNKWSMSFLQNWRKWWNFSGVILPGHPIQRFYHMGFDTLLPRRRICLTSLARALRHWILMDRTMEMVYPPSRVTHTILPEKRLALSVCVIWSGNVSDWQKYLPSLPLSLSPSIQCLLCFPYDPFLFFCKKKSMFMRPQYLLTVRDFCLYISSFLQQYPCCLHHLPVSFEKIVSASANQSIQ